MNHEITTTVSVKPDVDLMGGLSDNPRFDDSWTAKDCQFAEWICKVDDDLSIAFCAACKVSISAVHSKLAFHQRLKRHQLNLKEARTLSQGDCCDKDDTDDGEERSEIENQDATISPMSDTKQRRMKYLKVGNAGEKRHLTSNDVIREKRRLNAKAIYQKKMEGMVADDVNTSRTGNGSESSTDQRTSGSTLDDVDTERYGRETYKIPVSNGGVASDQGSINTSTAVNTRFKGLKFQIEWLSEKSSFSTWLKPYPKDESIAYCKICKVFIKADKTVIQKHEVNMRHKESMARLSMPVISDVNNHSVITSCSPTTGHKRLLTTKDDLSTSPEKRQAKMTDDLPVRQNGEIKTKQISGDFASPTHERSIATPKRDLNSETNVLHKGFRFQNAWLKIESFAMWLKPYPRDNSLAYCKACNKFTRAHKFDLNKHQSTSKHKVAMLRIHGVDPTESSRPKQQAVHYSQNQSYIPQASQPLRQGCVGGGPVRSTKVSMLGDESQLPPVLPRMPVFRSAWLKDPDLSPWVQTIPGNQTRAWCVVCERDVRAHKNDLNKHRNSTRHIKKMDEQEEGEKIPEK